MLSKKVLFLVASENEMDTLLSFSKIFKEKYKVEVDALYVKDVLKYQVYPTTIEGIGLNVGTNFSFAEYKELENKNFEKIEKKMKKNFSKVYFKEGETVEIALEELKKYDVLVVVKNDY